MASYRDHGNPEAVHFPGSLTAKVLICAGVFICLLMIPVAAVTRQEIERTSVEIGFVVLMAGLMLLGWPAHLVVDQFGTSSRRFRRFNFLFIDHKNVESAEPGSNKGPFLGLRRDTYIVRSADGTQIVHGPMHGDRDRFVRELRKRGVKAADPYLPEAVSPVQSSH